MIIKNKKIPRRSVLLHTYSYFRARNDRIARYLMVFVHPLSHIIILLMHSYIYCYLRILDFTTRPIINRKSHSCNYYLSILFGNFSVVFETSVLSQCTPLFLRTITIYKYIYIITSSPDWKMLLPGHIYIGIGNSMSFKL